MDSVVLLPQFHLSDGFPRLAPVCRPQVSRSSLRRVVCSLPVEPPSSVVNRSGRTISPAVSLCIRQKDATKISNVAANVATALPDVELLEKDAPTISRKDFPPGFTFGTATSAFQIEGAAREGGRGLSVWDTFTHQPGRIADGSNAVVACGHYEHVVDDIQLIKNLGVDAYRFSISWSRLLPDGKNVNIEAVDFYNDLINRLIMNGLTPYLTIYHWDMPQILENDPNVLGWRTRAIVPYFELFSETCFRQFGDRVKNWITINELHITSIQAYGIGRFAPGRCTEISGRTCPVGDSRTEPYFVTHNQHLSHAAAVKIYRTKYQKEQNGIIGVSFDSFWSEPYTQTPADKAAAQRSLEFELGWQMDPVMFGDYPKSMRDRVGSRLPQFTPSESNDLKGSFDFIAINYYTAAFAKDNPEVIEEDKRWWGNDGGAIATDIGPDGEPIGKLMGPPENPWLYDCPWGLYNIFAWIDERYGKVPLYISENGTMDDNADAPLNQILDDQGRIGYLKGHLDALSRVIKDKKMDVRGYFLWSLMDNFEWASGFTARFGLFYVNFRDENLQRIPKASAKWYTQLLKEKEEV